MQSCKNVLPGMSLYGDQAGLGINETFIIPPAPYRYGGYKPPNPYRYGGYKPPNPYRYNYNYARANYVPPVAPAGPAALLDKPGEALYSGIAEPTLNLNLESTGFGQASWFTRLENTLCNLSFSEALRRALTVNVVNVGVLLGLIVLLTLLVIPYTGNDCYNWFWGAVVGAIAYLLFSTTLRCMLNV
jgi:hypothetical protein